MEQNLKRIVEDLDERWKSLTIADNFVFGKVMLDESICREVLEAILNVPIERIEYVGHEEEMEVAPDVRGVRLDAYVRDGKGTVYDIEMQATNTRELPQRARYYQAMLAFAQLEKGVRYRHLKDSYVIFICGFDLFGQGRRVYSFTNREDADCSLQLGDGTHTIFLAATSPTEPGKGAQVNELLDYVSQGKVSGALSGRLQEAVAHVLENHDWRIEYMLQEVRDQLNVDKGRELGFSEGREKGLIEGREQGLAEGREKGLAEGHEAGLAEGREAGLAEGHEAGLQEGRELGLAEGESRFAKLARHLVEDDRVADLPRATSDATFRERLYQQYGIET